MLNVKRNVSEKICVPSDRHENETRMVCTASVCSAFCRVHSTVKYNPCCAVVSVTCTYVLCILLDAALSINQSKIKSSTALG